MIVPNLGNKIPITGSIKTIMSSQNTTMGINKVVSFEEAAKEKVKKNLFFLKDFTIG